VARAFFYLLYFFIAAWVNYAKMNKAHAQKCPKKNHAVFLGNLRLGAQLRSAGQAANQYRASLDFVSFKVLFNHSV
jgi:hypothetical protein